jgi:predicted ribonuclease YlaK
MDKDMFLVLYKSIVRLLLEYCTPVWSPYLKKDVRKIESIQRRATKLILIVKDLSYENRLNTIGLPTLEYRRDRYDMIQVYKALHDIDDIKWQNMFTLSANQTRGHHLKLVKKRCNTTQRLNTFSMRIVDHWNNLSKDTDCKFYKYIQK